jgi:hypothetical protein
MRHLFLIGLCLGAAVAVTGGGGGGVDSAGQGPAGPLPAI